MGDTLRLSPSPLIHNLLQNHHHHQVVVAAVVEASEVVDLSSVPLPLSHFIGVPTPLRSSLDQGHHTGRQNEFLSCYISLSCAILESKM